MSDVKKAYLALTVLYPYPIVAAPCHRWPKATKVFDQLSKHAGIFECLWVDGADRIVSLPPLPPLQRLIIPALLPAPGLPTPNAPKGAKGWRPSESSDRTQWTDLSGGKRKGKGWIQRKTRETGLEFTLVLNFCFLRWSSVYNDWIWGNWRGRWTEREEEEGVTRNKIFEWVCKKARETRYAWQSSWLGFLFRWEFTRANCWKEAGSRITFVSASNRFQLNCFYV